MCCSKVFQGIVNEHGDEVCARATEILWQADEHFSDPTHKEFHILLYCKSGNHRSRGAPQRINRFTHSSRPTGSKFTHSCSQPAGQPDLPPTHPSTHPPTHPDMWYSWEAACPHCDARSRPMYNSVAFLALSSVGPLWWAHGSGSPRWRFPRHA